MDNKNKILLTTIVSILMVSILSFKQSKLIPSNVKKNNQALTIDTFSTLPPEIEGCSCTFSNDSIEYQRRKYIYANDFGQIAFLKINGILMKFDLTEFKEVNNYTSIAKEKNDLYEITITVIDVKHTGEETFSKTGTIKLSDKKGRTITKTFYGECGC